MSDCLGGQVENNSFAHRSPPEAALEGVFFCEHLNELPWPQKSCDTSFSRVKTQCTLTQTREKGNKSRMWSCFKTIYNACLTLSGWSQSSSWIITCLGVKTPPLQTLCSKSQLSYQNHNRDRSIVFMYVLSLRQKPFWCAANPMWLSSTVNCTPTQHGSGW